MKKNNKKPRFSEVQKVGLLTVAILLIMVIAFGSFLVYIKVSKDNCYDYADRLPNPNGINDMKVSGRYFQCIDDKGLGDFGY